MADPQYLILDDESRFALSTIASNMEKTTTLAQRLFDLCFEQVKTAPDKYGFTQKEYAAALEAFSTGMLLTKDRPVVVAALEQCAKGAK